MDRAERSELHRALMAAKENWKLKDIASESGVPAHSLAVFSGSTQLGPMYRRMLRAWLTDHGFLTVAPAQPAVLKK